jgi:hypothetical protein
MSFLMYEEGIIRGMDEVMVGGVGNLNGESGGLS